MSEVYCKAPWVSVSYMPGGKYAPCCQWAGDFFDSQQEMTDQVGGAFLRGEVPEQCSKPCPANSPGWRSNFDRFETDYETHKIQFLDFRNNNLCNMKCRSCGPQFSTSWSSEARQTKIALHEPTSIDDIDLSQCRQVYFAGGEPLLNPQHYEVLEKLIALKQRPFLMYSTNLSVLGYKDKSVQELWKHFPNINVHASIDAVGEYAEIVRSGSVWADIESNLNWLQTQPNINIRIGTVISAINIWFMPSLFEYIKWLKPPHLFMPVLAYPNSVIGLKSIPSQYRPKLKSMLIDSGYADDHNIKQAIDILSESSYNEQNWYQFLSQQLILDNYRKERWFDLLPVRHQVYREALQIGQT